MELISKSAWDTFNDDEFLYFIERQNGKKIILYNVKCMLDKNKGAVAK